MNPRGFYLSNLTAPKLRFIATVAMLLTVMPFVGLLAQNTLTVTQTDNYYEKGLELFEREKYASAKQMFERFLDEDGNGEKAIQSQYYIGLSSLRLNNPGFEDNLLDFTTDYPTHPKTKKAFFHLGSYYFRKADYQQAQKYLERSGIDYIEDDEDIEALFKLAYSYFQLGDKRQAARIFNQIKAGNHEYVGAANYYAGYLNYEKGDYQTALSDLEQASLDPNLQEETNSLIPGIYYKLNRYQEVLDFVNKKESSGQKLPPELNLLAGECYFRIGQFDKAGQYFEKYLSESDAPEDRVINYRIGYAYVRNQQAQEAIGFLNKAADGQDSLAQVAAYHLGVTHLSLNNKELAVAAFEKCRQLKLDPKLTEMGGFYHVKVNYDIGDYTLAIASAKEYLAAHPNGAHSQEVFKLIGEAMLNTGDYDTALEYLDQINQKDYRVQAAYQEIAYNKAVQEYNDERYRSSVNSLKKSLTYKIDQNLTNSANFWLGEIYSLGNKYDTALIHYRQVSLSSPLYQSAMYGMAYAFYNNKDYQSAQQYFLQFLRNASNVPQQKRTDALIRLADCFYVAKNYNDAMRNYDLAAQQSPDEADYVFFQRGLIFRFQNRLNDALNSFDYIIARYPNSNYKDQAYYQKAEIYLQGDRRAEAINIYTKLINEYPNSQLIPYALAKRALAANLSGRQEIAVSDYKTILDEHIANQSLAETAIEALQEINSTGYRIPDLPAYLTNFSQVYAESPAVLKGKFEAAERPFGEGNYEQAILSLSQFVGENPQGAYTDEAYFKLGFSYEMIEDQENAVKSYQRVGGEFEERSVSNMAEIEYDRGNYNQAIQHYTRLKEIARRDRYNREATIGLMKSYFEVNDLEATAIYAQEIIRENMSRSQNIAELYKGKVFLAQQDYNAAIAQFQKTISLAQDKHAAEAQYLIGKSLRGQGQYEASIQALITVKKNYETYSKWIYEAFLLIAENYVNLDNMFQAKATLESIIEYSDDPGVVERAKKRLEEIS